MSLHTCMAARLSVCALAAMTARYLWVLDQDDVGAWSLTALGG